MTFSSLKALLLGTCLTALFLSPTFSEKDTERRKKAAPTLVEQNPAQQRHPKYRAKVDQVVLHAAVYDENMQLVSGLRKENFKVFEDKVEQELTYFGQEDVPTTIGIVMDTSGSMRDKMHIVKKATTLFLNMSHPENELFLVEFNDEVLLEENFTSDMEEVQDSLDNLISGGGTAFYDAVFLAVEKAREGAEPRKALVVFTDGEDKDSYYKHEEVLEKIRESEVQVHIVAFLDPRLDRLRPFFGIFKSQRQKARKKITTLAEYTGGTAFFPEQVKELEGVFETIAQELRKQYRFSYISSNPVRDGTWRDIDVVVEGAKEKGWTVRAKRGYFARNQEDPQ